MDWRIDFYSKQGGAMNEEAKKIIYAATSIVFKQSVQLLIEYEFDALVFFADLIHVLEKKYEKYPFLTNPLGALKEDILCILGVSLPREYMAEKQKLIQERNKVLTVASSKELDALKEEYDKKLAHLRNKKIGDDYASASSNLEIFLSIILEKKETYIHLKSLFTQSEGMQINETLSKEKRPDESNRAFEIRMEFNEKMKLYSEKKKINEQEANMYLEAEVRPLLKIYRADWANTVYDSIFRKFYSILDYEKKQIAILNLTPDANTIAALGYIRRFATQIKNFSTVAFTALSTFKYEIYKNKNLGEYNNLSFLKEMLKKTTDLILSQVKDLLKPLKQSEEDLRRQLAYLKATSHLKVPSNLESQLHTSYFIDYFHSQKMQEGEKSESKEAKKNIVSFLDLIRAVNMNKGFSKLTETMKVASALYKSLNLDTQNPLLYKDQDTAQVFIEVFLDGIMQSNYTLLDDLLNSLNILKEHDKLEETHIAIMNGIRIIKQKERELDSAFQELLKEYPEQSRLQNELEQARNTIEEKSKLNRALIEKEEVILADLNVQWLEKNKSLEGKQTEALNLLQEEKNKKYIAIEAKFEKNKKDIALRFSKEEEERLDQLDEQLIEKLDELYKSFKKDKKELVSKKYKKQKGHLAKFIASREDLEEFLELDSELKQLVQVKFETYEKEKSKLNLYAREERQLIKNKIDCSINEKTIQLDKEKREAFVLCDKKIEKRQEAILKKNTLQSELNGLHGEIEKHKKEISTLQKDKEEIALHLDDIKKKITFLSDKFFHNKSMFEGLKKEFRESIIAQLDMISYLISQEKNIHLITCFRYIQDIYGVNKTLFFIMNTGARYLDQKTLSKQVDYEAIIHHTASISQKTSIPEIEENPLKQFEHKLICSAAPIVLNTIHDENLKAFQQYLSVLSATLSAEKLFFLEQEKINALEKQKIELQEEINESWFEKIKNDATSWFNSGNTLLFNLFRDKEAPPSTPEESQQVNRNRSYSQ